MVNPGPGFIDRLRVVWTNSFFWRFLRATSLFVSSGFASADLADKALANSALKTDRPPSSNRLFPVGGSAESLGWVHCSAVVCASFPVSGSLPESTSGSSRLCLTGLGCSFSAGRVVSLRRLRGFDIGGEDGGVDVGRAASDEEIAGSLLGLRLELEIGPRGLKKARIEPRCGRGS